MPEKMWAQGETKMKEPSLYVTWLSCKVCVGA